LFLISLIGKGGENATALSLSEEKRGMGQGGELRDKVTRGLRPPRRERGGKEGSPAFIVCHSPMEKKKKAGGKREGAAPPILEKAEKEMAPSLAEEDRGYSKEGRKGACFRDERGDEALSFFSEKGGRKREGAWKEKRGRACSTDWAHKKPIEGGRRGRVSFRDYADRKRK